MNDLLFKVTHLKTETYKKIMFRLMFIYDDECSCNEGSFTFSDLVYIYNLLYFSEIKTIALEGGGSC